MEKFFESASRLASEYYTGAKHEAGRTLSGIDETAPPVIFEYKRSRDRTSSTRGPVLTSTGCDTNRGEFKLLVMDRARH